MATTGKLGRDLLGGVLLTVALLFGIELVLGAVGIAPRATGAISRGFDATAAYIVPDPEREGGFVTQLNRPDMGVTRIPPRRRAPRVLLFGGSNTASFPAGELAGRMMELSPGVNVEAINLGVQGYGSGRVTILVEQSLAVLDPDLALIYSGHNEFVEAGFAMDVAAVETRSALGKVAERTRLYAALAGEKSATTPHVSPQTQPERWKWEYEKFLDLTYDQTLARFETYRENLRAMCRVARERGTKVVLCTPIYNRLAAPFSSTLAADVDPARAAEIARLLEAARAALPADLLPLFPREEQERVHAFDWGIVPAKTTLAEAGTRGMRFGSGPLSAVDPEHAPTEHWKPKVWALDRALAALWARDFDEQEVLGLRLAGEHYASVLAVADDHPAAAFGAGVVALASGGDLAAARMHLERAARFDRAPRKASQLTSEIVRAVAAEFPEVLLVDSDAWMSEHAPDGIVGWDVMVDHCHLARGHRAALMRHVGERIHERWSAATLLAERRNP